MKIQLKAAGWIILLLILGSPLALAKGLGGGPGHHGGGSESGSPSGFGKGEKHGWQGESTPPGWDKGKKKGWDGADMPPGLKNKKQGSHDEKDKDGK